MSKPGRNDPCPCGSGKKYKRCCIGKEEIISSKDESFAAGYGSEEDSTDAAFSEDSELEEVLGNFDPEEVTRMFARMRTLMLNDKPHIKEYKKLRGLHSEILGSMMEYFHDGNYKPKTPTDEQALANAKLCNDEADRYLLLECDFDSGTREGEQGLLESIIYPKGANMDCITEVFIEKRRFRKPEKIEFLQCMMDSRAGLFEVTGKDASLGYVELLEVFTGQKYKITDIALSGNQDEGEVYLYTRIITCRGISFSSGLGLMFDKTDPFIDHFIKQEGQNYFPQGEFRRFIETYNHFSQNPNRHRVLQNTLK